MDLTCRWTNKLAIIDVKIWHVYLEIEDTIAMVIGLHMKLTKHQKCKEA